MKLLFNKISFQHDTGMHPENRKRLEAFAGLQEITPIDGAPFLELVHDRAYIERVKKAHLASSHIDPDTAISPGSFAAAVAAVGMTIMVRWRRTVSCAAPADPINICPKDHL